MTSPTPEPTPADREHAASLVRRYEYWRGAFGAEKAGENAIATALAAVRAEQSAETARNILVGVRASMNAAKDPIAWAAMMESERDAALAREAALVEECVAGRLAQDIFNEWAAALEGRGELPDRVRAEHLSKEYRRIRTQNESAHNSTAAAEARDKKLKDEARIEGMEQEREAWYSLEADICNEPLHTSDERMGAHMMGASRRAAIRRAAAAPETPAP